MWPRWNYPSRSRQPHNTYAVAIFWERAIKARRRRNRGLAMVQSSKSARKKSRFGKVQEATAIKWPAGK